MSNLAAVKSILENVLQLGSRADALTEQSALLGALPELDSLAVVAILTEMEQRLDISIHDDEVSADTFETLGSLVRFVNEKQA